MVLVDKRIVITGGLGFIGSNIGRKLSEKNEILLIDNLSTGKIENINDFKDKENVSFIKGDIRNLDFLNENFKNIDFVFHQAAIASVPKSIKDPYSTNETNITGTLNVLNASKANNVKKVMLASSCAIYGEPKDLPINENCKVDPLSPYSLTKLVGEYYCKYYSYFFKLPTVCLRYFNVYGPYQDPNGEYAAVIPKFILSILTNKSPIIYGDGCQTRDFIFIEDVVNANIFAAENQISGIFNIGSGQETSINALYKKIRQISGKDINALYKDTRAGDIKVSYADITKIKKQGYTIDNSLDSGLEKTYTWFRNTYK